jgi:ElaA protein
MIVFKNKRFDELTTTELYKIIKIRFEVFICEQTCFYQDLDDKDFESIHLMGYENNELVAYARLLPKGVSYENYCAIGRVLTKETARRKGYGIELMNRAIEICKQEFGGDIKISAQQYLEKFYSDFGFKTGTEMYFEDQIPHVGMVLKVTQSPLS